MKRSRKAGGLVVGLILMFVLATGTTAYAYPFADPIYTWGEILGIPVDARLIVEGAPFTYTHDLNQEVDFAHGDVVTQAFLELRFINDLNDGYQLDGLITWDFREFVTVGFDGSNWENLDEVDNSSYLLVLTIDWLNDDGFLDVTIEVSNQAWNWAEVWLDYSFLYGEAECTSVPEPGTLLLLGLGLFGIVALGRKKLFR